MALPSTEHIYAGELSLLELFFTGHIYRSGTVYLLNITGELSLLELFIYRTYILSWNCSFFTIYEIGKTDEPELKVSGIMIFKSVRFWKSMRNWSSGSSVIFMNAIRHGIENRWEPGILDPVLYSWMTYFIIWNLRFQIHSESEVFYIIIIYELIVHGRIGRSKNHYDPWFYFISYI